MCFKPSFLLEKSGWWNKVKTSICTKSVKYIYQKRGKNNLLNFVSLNETTSSPPGIQNHIKNSRRN
jgi:hypothetical protein